ncbi:MAG: YtxH domain-containing protein, partial [Clostridia bacterium]|nr:YtxH domain-containing protein [Clostridia bacterium]
MKTLGYIAAVIGGAVAGATAALLLAPEKGEDTRAKLQDYAKECYDKIDI